MSQSDYIKHLKLSRVLKEQTELNPVLDSAEYTLYKEYMITNIVKNTTSLYGKFSQPEITNVFGMPLRDISNCPVFVECMDTNNREYRNPLLNVYFTPRPVIKYNKEVMNNRCSASCHDVSINGSYKTKCNFFNRDFTKYSNYRLRKMLCDCRRL